MPCTAGESGVGGGLEVRESMAAGGAAGCLRAWGENRERPVGCMAEA